MSATLKLNHLIDAHAIVCFLVNVNKRVRGSQFGVTESLLQVLVERADVHVSGGGRGGPLLEDCGQADGLRGPKSRSSVPRDAGADGAKRLQVSVVALPRAATEQVAIVLFPERS